MIKNIKKEKTKNKWEQGENGKAQWQSLTSRSNQAKHRMPNTPRLRLYIFVTCVRGVRAKAIKEFDMKGRGLLLLSIIYLGIESIFTLVQETGAYGVIPSVFFSWKYSIFGFIFPFIAFVSLVYVFAKNRELLSVHPLPQLSTNQIESAEITNQSENNDDRVVCTCCGKRMIPRIITGPPLVHPRGGWTPVPKKSICPFCGTTYQKFPASAGQVVSSVVFVIVFIMFAGYLLSQFRF